jgi:hypothetical protein
VISRLASDPGTQAYMERRMKDGRSKRQTTVAPPITFRFPASCIPSPHPACGGRRHLGCLIYPSKMTGHKLLTQVTERLVEG